MAAGLYENDFYLWTIEQSQKLRCGNFDGLDLQNLAEEIESLGRQEKRELENRLGVLIGHLLKWQYQQEKRTRSWQITINTQRREINKLLKDNPSLKSYLNTALQEGFISGLDLVLTETPLKKKELPSQCPYTIEQVFDSTFPVDLETEFE
ncbi:MULTISPECIES: DUF29 domain-containing protein [Sphaerospermopsis]|jgi:hypothetical protein|uniref:DUF29 domain-containing protein n=1 Tax=Sphaerospermopsis torques-reginae ITEP-024 TaxID=984208 RepID=A0ABX8WVR7_9CYAN|nr:MULTISPECIES: DUF29 domain-containing protein [Sphaerospermopsis]MBE9058685.1 DUF29 domain-containing protein [Sphaerospermopsis sp. LEGE 08334]QYX30514.1 DUF29 domain-containing protein [Sphaerospermopsis torques-reginae ITEP-024]